jgi:acyl-CoA reductase-like NAD-dependent aldehyde dehydrogenase
METRTRLPFDGNQIPETIECRNPATLEKLGDVPVLDRAQVIERVERARRAQRRWGEAGFAERRRVLSRLLDYIVAHQEEICRVCARDSGKTIVDAMMGEIFPVCEKLRYTISHGARDLRPEPRESGVLAHKRVRVEYPPLGVIGVLCPWNFPFHNVFCPVIPALAAGNAVVVKVSEWTSWSAADFQAIFDEVLVACGWDRDLVQIITGGGETGQALVQSGVDKIFFTGSPGNGRKVMSAAAETLTPVVLELGGKDPMIICDDADLDQAIGTAMLGVFTACGQMCVAAERLYVFDSIYDQFVRRVAEKVRALRQGPPSEDEGGRFDVGAMTMPRQLDIIERQVEDAVRKGARALVGGRRNASLRGQFWEPTLLVDVTHEMAIAREETFGPVMTIVRVRDEDEAVRLANDCAYGLGSSVFTRDAARGERIAARISAGMTVVNDYGLAYMMQSAPFGGVRISGFGRINGREGLRACCNVKTIVSDRLPIHQAVSFYPIKKATFPLLQNVISIIYGSGISTRFKAIGGLAQSLWRMRQ